MVMLEAVIGILEVCKLMPSRFCTLSPTILSARSVRNKCIHPAHDYFVEVQSQLIRMYTHLPQSRCILRVRPLLTSMYSSACRPRGCYTQLCTLHHWFWTISIHSHPRRDSGYTVHRVNPFPIPLQLRVARDPCTVVPCSAQESNQSPRMDETNSE